MDSISQSVEDIDVVDDVIEEPVETKVAQDNSSDVTAKNIYRHPAAHPVVLDLCMTKRFGTDWLMWESETIERVLAEQGGISHVNLSKLQACRTLHLVDTFWGQWEVFLPCCMSFNGIPPDFVQMQVPSVLQCMIAVDTANRIRDGVQWSNEVKLFIESVFRHDSFAVPLEPLNFITVETYGHFLDVQDICKRWPACYLAHKAPEGDTAEDEQLRRMLDAYEQLDDVRSALRRQLKAVLNA